VAEGDKVVVWWTARGTHLGELDHPVFGRVAPTGKELTVSGISIHQVVGGKLVEGIVELSDQLGLGQQLGVIPRPDQSPAVLEANKAVVRRIVEEVWNTGNLAAVEELWAPTVTVHGQLLTHEDIRWRIQRMRAARPDLRCTIEDLIAEGDRVVLRWRSEGTQTGELLLYPADVRIAPTGKRLSIAAINIFRLVNRQVVEVWELRDVLSQLDQLGATVVAPPAAGA
jgi:predicted ester cyclase